MSEQEIGKRNLSHNLQWLGIVLALVAATTFGSVAILAKQGFNAGAQPLALLTVRYAMAFAILLSFGIVAKKTREMLPAGGRQIWLLMLLGVLYGFETVLYFEALKRSPAAIVALIFFTYPLWTMALGLLAGLGEPGVRLFVALLIGMAGISIVFPFSKTDLTGPLLALGGAIVISLYFLGAEILLKGIKPYAATLWTTLGAGAGCGIAAGSSGEFVLGNAIPAAAGLGLVTAIAFASLLSSIQFIGSSRSAIATMFEPIVTMVLAVIILNEPVTVRILFGALLLVSCIAVLATAPSGRAPLQPDAPEIVEPDTTE